MIDDPARRLSAMDVLESAEHDRLDTWSNREIPGPTGEAPVSIPEMFSRQVERDPGAPALTFEDRVLTL